VKVSIVAASRVTFGDLSGRPKSTEVIY